MTYGAHNQSALQKKTQKPGSKTDLTVSQPRLEVISLRRARPPWFNHWLKKPSGAMPFEGKKLLSNEVIMPATVCELVVSWSRGWTTQSGARNEERKTHRYRLACAVYHIECILYKK